MLDDQELDKIIEKFDFHPLIIARSIEHANSLGELFDILSTIPKQYPISWDQEKNRWINPLKDQEND